MDKPTEVAQTEVVQKQTDAELGELSVAVGQALLSAGATCVTAESCTGGLVAKLLTDIAGSSSWFVGGFVCYSNACKHSMLGVPEQVIADAGAVSEEVADALATGAIMQTGAHIAVSISGVAGPGGGSKDKPVGTVWIGCATAGLASGGRRVTSRQYNFSGSRDQIRRAAAARALRDILEATRIQDQGS